MLGFLFIALLQIFAGCIIWAILVATFFVLLAADTFVSLKAGEFLICKHTSNTYHGLGFQGGFLRDCL